MLQLITATASSATVDYSNVTGCEQCYNRLQQRDWLQAVSQSITAMCLSASSVTIDYSNVTGCEQCYSRLQQHDWLRAVLQSITAT